MEGTISEIRMFAGNFAPRGWNFCDGSILSIAQNTALFSLLGTTYGGNGQTTFALPDLRGRVPLGTGTGPGLPDVVLGEMSGSNSTTLTTNEMPAHTHTATATVTPKAGTGKITLVDDPTNNYPGQTSPTNAMYTTSNNASMGSFPANVQLGLTGGNQPISLMQPYLGMNYIICLEGMFPSRN